MARPDTSKIIGSAFDKGMAIRNEYEKVKDEKHTRLHRVHVPVIDEDDRRIDFLAIIGEALPPYEELFRSRKGFTAPEETARFVRESACSWLSVAIGNIYGAISATGKQKDKPLARIDISHLNRLKAAANIPLVLHGGSGIPKEYIQKAVANGIAKFNVATAIRKPYERNLDMGIKTAQNAGYETTWELFKSELSIDDSVNFFTRIRST